MKQYAIIVAGGVGSRMQNALPKQFLPINGKPLLYYCIAAFVDTFPEIELVVVVHPNYFSFINEILQLFTERINVQIVPGGNTRYASVKNGLDVIPASETEALVYVHDAARPFINKTFLLHLQKEAMQFGNAIPCIPIAESVRMVKENNEIKSSPIDRGLLRIVQTPQVFFAKNIKKCFEMPYQDAFTDEATVCQLHGETIHMTEGLEDNIKIITPSQLIFAEWYLPLFLNQAH